MLRSASRLIIVFILTMIISGGILTYQGIASISNLRELTEKKIAEEQLSMADELSARFLEFLEKIAGQFAEFTREANASSTARVADSDTLDFVENPFITGPKGDFLWPVYLEELPMNMGYEPLQAYADDYLTAQQLEFREQDPGAAATLYNRSLGHAASAVDSARARNALGRVHMKQQEYGRARSYFSGIIANDPSVLDNNGFPFAYYALSNLLMLRESEKISEIIPDLTRFLKGTLDGTIPLNSSTSDLLARISALVGTEHTDSLRGRELHGMIREIKGRLRFIDRFGDLIRASLEQWNGEGSHLHIGSFMAISNPAVEAGRLVLINQHGSHTLGFSLFLDSIWPPFMETGSAGPAEFDYTIRLTTREARDRSNAESLVNYSTLAPWFPAYEVRIGLKDENLVEIFLQKRRWSYGIALFLLLGAMLIGILLILRDIAREKNLGRLRSDFVSNVTHELKTPLTSIHLLTESVLLDRVDPESGKKEYLQIILKETERLKRMINNILDFSKHEQGKLDYKPEQVNLTALVRSSLKELNYWLEELKFRVQTDLEEGVEVSGDPDALKQVIINLLDNAIKYSGSVKEIGVNLSMEKQGVRLEFIDKGIGIPADQLNAIFDKFYRVNDQLVEGMSGTGLGLTVVKEIVEYHGGKIMVESEPGKGSKFTLYFNST